MKFIKRMCITAFVGILPVMMYAKRESTVKPSDRPIFTNVEYSGHDSVFIKNPLGENEFYNPILQGCYPDPSICRKGNDYYLVCSSFVMVPGAPIFHSKDLVNWQQIGHVLDRPSQLHVTERGTSQGMMAPSISYNPANDTFYMITTVDGNFVVKAKNPAGPWSDPIRLNFRGIDPSLFFDDNGKAYIVHNDAPRNPSWDGHRIIRMWEYDVDKDSLVPGSSRVIVNGGTKFHKKPFWIEAPHIYKRNGKYYLMCAEGGTGDTHSEVVFMSDSVTGPYIEAPSNPILSQRHLNPNRDYKVDWAGHSDVVQGPDGNMYGVFLAIRPNINGRTVTGRETFILPVDWSGKWPVFENGLTPIEPKLKLPAGVVNRRGKDGFLPHGNYGFHDDLSADTLDYRWIGLRKPVLDMAILTGKGLQFIPNEYNITHNRPLSAAWTRQIHNDFSFSTDIIYKPRNEKDLAGIACIQSNKYNYVFGITRRGKQYFIVLQRTADGVSSVVASSPLVYDGKINLMVSAADDEYHFAYSLDGGVSYVSLGTPQSGDILSTDVAGGFVGNMLGLYSTANNTALPE